MKIKKGESRLVLYSIFPHPKMQGSVVASALFNVNRGGVNILMKLPVHLTMQGTEKIVYSIDKISLEKFNGVNRLNVAIKNDGNVIVQPVGMLDIYKGKKKIKSVQLLETVSVFPETLRDMFYINLPDDLEEGKYRAEVKIELIGYKYFVKPAIKNLNFRVLKDGSMQALK
jgi:hypothetical protein